MAVSLQQLYKVGQGDIVPIYVDQTPKLLVSVLGILKAGAAYTPIPRDDSWPAKRVQQIIQQCHTKVVVSDTSIVPGIDDGIPIFNICLPYPPQKVDGVFKCPATGTSPSYVLWTSGTTGDPKGVVMSHHAAYTCISRIGGHLYPMKSDDRVLQFSSPVFDISVVDYFATLSIGATLCMAPRTQLMEDLNGTIVALRPTTASLTPTVARLINPETMHLHTLVVSGELVSRPLIEQYTRTGTRLINGYGPTESNMVTFIEIRECNSIDSIGRPFDSSLVVILDIFGSLAPAFVPGEIHIGGPQVFTSYLGQKKLTDRVLAIHEPCGQLYATGDIGFYDDAGNLHFCGRRDGQIKLNGRRIETEGISSVILQLEFIEECVIVQVGTQLAAFLIYNSLPSQSQSTEICIIPHEEGRLKEIRAHVDNNIPSGLAPAMWYRIRRLPLTISGKLDTRVLKDLADGIERDRELVAPENEVERITLEKCVEVLGKPISVLAHLFDYGLDSFLAIALISKLRLAFPHYTFSLQSLLSHAVPRELAKAIQKQLSTAPAIICPDSPKRIAGEHGVAQRYITSSMQKRLCLAQDVFQDATYAMFGLFEVREACLDSIEESLRELVRQNTIFQTHFVFESSKGYEQAQSIDFDVEMETLDVVEGVDGLPSDMLRTVTAMLQEQFDIAQAPPFRFKIFSQSSGKAYVFVNFHHTLMDEHSMQILTRNLDDYLSAGTRKVPRSLPSRLQYTNFCADEQIALSDQYAVNKSLGFWKEHLHEMSSPVMPRFSAPTTSNPSLGTFTYAFTVPQNALRWVRVLGMTEFSSFLVGLQIALKRCWSWSDPTILVPISQRGAKFADVYGCFLNTVPIHFSPSLSQSLEKVMLASSKLLMEAMDHAYIPFETILESTGHHTDDFPFMFVFHRNLRDGLVLNHLRDVSDQIRHLCSNTKPKFPITFSVTTSQDNMSFLSVEINVDFDQGIIPLPAVAHFCRQYEAVVDAVSKAGKESIIGELEIMTDNEQFLTGRSIQPQRNSILPLAHEFVKKSVEQHPDQTACLFEGTASVTYGELWRQIRSILHALLPRYCQKDDRVAIAMRAGVDRVAAMIGAMMAGFAFVPIDIEWPSTRIAYVLKDCAPAAILVSSATSITKESALSEALSSLGGMSSAALVFLDESITLQYPTTEERTPTIEGCNLAYILYTSGTTGSPKGVQIEHGALSHSLTEHCSIYQLTPRSRLLQVSPWTFDVAVMDVFATLSQGATLCLGSKDYLFSCLQKTVADIGITHIATTPTIAALLPPDQIPTLEVLAIGGEPMTRVVQRLWGERQLFNVYGPTEATVNVTYTRVFPHSPVKNIGKPLMGVSVYILDDELHEVSLGSTGQLAIGGQQLARGYTDPSLNTSVFKTHPTFGRIFLTGDVARYGKDGSIYHLGRRDNQVKLRGLRIELEEIEAVVGASTEIESSIAMVTQINGTDVICLAFKPTGAQQSISSKLSINLGTGLESIPHHLEELAEKSLPRYAIPSYWVPLTEVPRTSHGKLDRDQVRQAVLSLTQDELSYFNHKLKHFPAKRTPLSSTAEATLAACIQDVLGRADLFKESNFFALLGDSISAIRLCSKANHHGIHLRISDIYQQPTIEGLAKLVSQKMGISPVAPTTGSFDIVSLPPIVEWFCDLEKKNQNWYNQTMMIRMESIEAMEKLPKAWETIVQQHPSLRIKLRRVKGKSRMVLSASPGTKCFALHRQDVPTFDVLLSQIPMVASSIHLADGPISSLGLFIVGNAPYAVICAHHIAVDIVSWQIIFDDLKLLLRGKDILPEFASVEQWCHYLELKKTARLKHSNLTTSNWSSANLSIVPNFSELSHLNTASTSHSLEVNLHRELTTILFEGSRKLRTEVQDILIASLLLAFHRWKGIQEVELCLESHGRSLRDEAIDISRTVGWFTAMRYILFFTRGAEQDIPGLIAEVKDKRTATLGEVDPSVRWQSPNSETPTITFNYYGSHSTLSEDDVFQIVNLEYGRFDEDPRNLRFAAMDMGCAISNGVVSLTAIYSKPIQEKGDCELLLRLWSESLENVATYCLQETAEFQLTRHEVRGLNLDRHRLQDLIEKKLQPVGIKAEMIETIVPATDMQQSMLLASLEFGSYIESFTYAVNGTCDERLLAKSWASVIDKHQALRSVYIQPDSSDDGMSGNILQVILTPGSTRSWTRQNAMRNLEPLTFRFGSPTMRLWLHQSSEGIVRFTWEYHHALFDGWSARVVFRDLQEAYMGRLLPPTTTFETVRSRLLENSQDTRFSRFWKSELSNIEPTRLMDHLQTQSGSKKVVEDRRHDYELSYSFELLSRCAEAESITVSTILRSAWALALTIFTNKKDIVFGVTTSGRHLDVRDMEEVVGLCVNTVPIRILVDRQDSVSDYLQKVHNKSASLSENDTLSLRAIYEASRQSGLFDTVLVYQNYVKFPQDPEIPFTLELVESNEKTDIPLNIMASPTAADRIHVAALVHADHISRSYLDNLMQVFDIALCQLCIQGGNSEAKLGDIRLLDESAQSQLEEFSRGPPISRDTLCIWPLFMKTANSRMESNALEFYSEEKCQAWTYAKLISSVEIAALHFRNERVREGDMVGIYMDKCPACICIMLALFRLGAICVPFKYNSPADYVERLMQIANPMLLVVSKSEAIDSIRHDRRVYAEDLMRAEAALDSGVPSIEYRPDQPAMVLFTSGTTGVPKGVLMPTRQVAGYAVTMADAYKYKQNSRIFSFANYAFDVFISDVFGGLLAGSTICIAPQNLVISNLSGLLNASRSTHLNVTPSVAAMLLPDDLPFLVSLVLTGEPATSALFKTVSNIWRSFSPY